MSFETKTKVCWLTECKNNYQSHKMKALRMVLVPVLVLVGITQLMIMGSSSKIETYPYTVLKEYDDFEIRQYKSANFAYVTMDPGTYRETSGKGFRMLAGYIFGGNENEQKIAMTAPVAMEMEDSVTMMFMVPAEYKLEDLPKPNDSRVKFKTEPGKVMAAIRFGGWADDDKIEKYTEKLKAALAREGVDHKNNFSYMGYNAPYEIFGRRNEVVVEVEAVNL